MKTPYSQPIAPSQPAPAGIGLHTNKAHDSNLLPWIFISLGGHVGLALVVWLASAILGFLGLIPRFESLAMKPKDVEFVLVDNLPNEKPRKPTRNRAEHDSRSGGKKIANRPVAMPQQAAGAPSKASRAASQPAAKPQPAPRQAARPAQPKVAQSPARAQQPSQQVPTPQPPAPPMPKAPKPEKVANASPALPPSPVAPTIRTPAPPNPALSTSGPVAKTPGISSSSGSSGSSGGSPGPSLISGAPSRGGSGSSGGRAGGGGSGGHGAYNQSGSPGGGGGRPGIDAEAEPDFGPYIAELQRRIRRNWSPPTEDRSKRVVAVFRISRDGRLLSLTIQQSSGSPNADQAALAAVRASAPFRPLPPNYRGADIPVQFTFDYEISGHGSASLR
ncbi:MAG TPA: TonB family protein [Oculatellaceae cyanobacterium]